MMSFSFFFSARWSNYRRIRQYERRARLLMLHTESDPNRAGDLDEYEPSIANDITYEDAILGLEIRSFLRAEYGSAEPPQGVFRRVMRAIEQRSLAPANSSSHGVWTTYFQRMLNGPVAGRLVPSMVAFAVVLMVFGTNGMRFLSPHGAGLSLESPIVSPPPVGRQGDSKVTTAPTSEAIAIAGLELPIKDESQFYDRVELRLPAPRHTNKTDLTDDEPQLVQYDRYGSGAQ